MPLQATCDASGINEGVNFGEKEVSLVSDPAFMVALRITGHSLDCDGSPSRIAETLGLDLQNFALMQLVVRGGHMLALKCSAGIHIIVSPQFISKHKI